MHFAHTSGLPFWSVHFTLIFSLFLKIWLTSFILISQKCSMRSLFFIGFQHLMSQVFFKWKFVAFIEMALCEFERRTDGGWIPVSVKYIIFGSFKEGMIIVCQIIIETERMAIWYSLDLFRIPLNFTNLSEDLYLFFLPITG